MMLTGGMVSAMIVPKDKTLLKYVPWLEVIFEANQGAFLGRSGSRFHQVWFFISVFFYGIMNAALQVDVS